MESTGVPGRVHISADTHGLLAPEAAAAFRPRGEIPVKGKGPMLTYLQA